jgi:hypothetical protein
VRARYSQFPTLPRRCVLCLNTQQRSNTPHDILRSRAVKLMQSAVCSFSPTAGLRTISRPARRLQPGPTYINATLEPSLGACHSNILVTSADPTRKLSVPKIHRHIAPDPAVKCGRCHLDTWVQRQEPTYNDMAIAKPDDDVKRRQKNDFYPQSSAV